MVLQMAQKVVNDINGSNGIVSILLIFKAYSRIGENNLLTISII